jgi:hypothetical protein
MELAAYRETHNLAPQVYQTWRRWGRGWRPTGFYGIRFVPVGQDPEVCTDGDYRMTPVPDPV